MSAIRDWLRSLGFEQYTDTFEANDIDLDILPELSERDLEQLGVSLGNRRRLMKALAERASDPGSAEPVRTEAPDASADAERRQVTVLFCDMVGSTALSGEVDPELLGTLIRRYQDTVAGAIGRYGGFVAKFMGDGVLAYFGFPQAFEDGAERAVRAALTIIADVAGITRPDGSAVRARIGIATGLVVVGEIVGSGSAQERTIVGETPNLAARLQALAAPDTILISEATHNLIHGLFEVDSAGEHDLKGFARPVPAWRVACEASIVSRFAAIRAGATTPLVGRAHEMGLLLDRWRLARLGEGQIVTLIGEAGIGKSRAIEALQEAIAGEPHGRIYLQCSPYHSDSAFYPVIQHMSRAAGFVVGDSSGERMEKLTGLFSQRASMDSAAVPLLAELLSVPDAPPVPGSPTPAQRKAATLALLADEIVRLGEANTMLLIVEDAHWIDATTLELLTRISDGIARARLLVVVTARPDFSPPWLARAQATLLTLGRLGRTDCTGLIAGIAASQGLSAETIAAIVEKTDGVPLFVEELTKSVMESAGEAGATVPATLKDSLMARLDRLGDARDVAQIAAVIGRQFSLALLEAVVPKHGGELQAAIAKLVAAGIVFPEGRGLEQSFNFKHALLRDAAYESLLLARRRELHERTARALEECFPELAATEPELLAHHFGEAALAGPACDYRRRAGDRAVSRSAYQEAVAHYTAGIKEANTLSPEEGRERRLNLLLKLGTALTVTKGAQSADVEQVYRQANEAAEAVDDLASSYKAKWGLWFNANLGRKTAIARDRAEELVALAERTGDDGLLLEAYHCRWSTAFFRGDLHGARRNSEIGVARYQSTRHHGLAAVFGAHDPGVCAHVVLGISEGLSGYEEGARRQIEEAIILAETLQHPLSQAHALLNAAVAAQLVGDREGAEEMAERTTALTEKYGFPPYRLAGLILRAWARVSGRADLGSVELVEREIDRAVAAGPIAQHVLGMAGEVMLIVGRCAKAMALLDRALAANEERDVGYYLPEIHRLRGKCLLALDCANENEARQAFITARDIAQRQGVVIFERRAEEALGKLA